LDNGISGLEDTLFTGVSEKGIWVRLFHPAVEGKRMQRLEGFDVADRVRVQLIGTDVERGFIDFTRLG
jgi:ribonuclease R